WLHSHRLSDRLHAFSGDESTLGGQPDDDRRGRYGAGCSTGNNAITASADSGSDIAAAKPNGPHARAIAKTRRRGGGLTKHAGIGSPCFGSFAVKPEGGCNERPRGSCHCRDCAHTRQHSVDHEQGLQKRLSRLVLSDVHDTAPKVSATRLTLTCDKLGPPRARAALAN